MGNVDYDASRDWYECVPFLTRALGVDEWEKKASPNADAKSISQFFSQRAGPAERSKCCFAFSAREGATYAIAFALHCVVVRSCIYSLEDALRSRGSLMLSFHAIHCSFSLWPAVFF